MPIDRYVDIINKAEKTDTFFSVRLVIIAYDAIMGKTKLDNTHTGYMIESVSG